MDLKRAAYIRLLPLAMIVLIGLVAAVAAPQLFGSSARMHWVAWRMDGEPAVAIEGEFQGQVTFGDVSLCSERVIDGKVAVLVEAGSTSEVHCANGSLTFPVSQTGSELRFVHSSRDPVYWGSVQLASAPSQPAENWRDSPNFRIVGANTELVVFGKPHLVKVLILFEQWFGGPILIGLAGLMLSLSLLFSVILPVACFGASYPTWAQSLDQWAPRPGQREAAPNFVAIPIDYTFTFIRVFVDWCEVAGPGVGFALTASALAVGFIDTRGAGIDEASAVSASLGRAMLATWVGLIVRLLAVSITSLLDNITRRHGKDVVVVGIPKPTPDP